MVKYQIRGLDGSCIGEPVKVVYRKTVKKYQTAKKVGLELAEMLSDVYGRSYVEIVAKDNDYCESEVTDEIESAYNAHKSFDKAKLDAMVKELERIKEE